MNDETVLGNETGVQKGNVGKGNELGSGNDGGASNVSNAPYL
jgi:hypothetical protein